MTKQEYSFEDKLLCDTMLEVLGLRSMQDLNKLSLGDAQPIYDSKIKDFPV
jgi:hypothetical protein